MSYLVLARKYRSADFDDVIGQDRVARTLKRAIETGRIAHAYLFCGTRGVGKTSMARILAKALNCERFDKPTPTPCNKCTSCLAIARGEDMDVIEIDAASNTGVDNVRDLIANSQFHPARSRFKLYIIDEVHMLSKSAFNALLKTLEEPPEHVKFILATTEPEKVLPTILSRCQRYDFRSISSREIADRLREICKNEKIRADDEALLLIAKAGAGSMRDALSLLDRLLGYGEKNLSVEMLEQLLGMPRSQVIFDLVEAIGAEDVKKSLGIVDSQLRAGMSADTLIAGLTDHLRNLLIIRTCGPDSDLVEMPGLSMDELSKQASKFDPTTLSQDIVILEDLRRTLRYSQAGRALLDATIVRLALAAQFTSIEQLLEGLTSAPALKKNAEPLTPSPSTLGEREGNVAPISLDDLDGIWRTLLQLLSVKSKGLPALLQGAKLTGIEDGTAIVQFAHDHDAILQILDRNGKKEAIADVLTSLLKQQTGVKFEMESAAAKSEAPKPQKPARATAVRHSPAPPSGAQKSAPLRLTPELKQSLRENPLIAAIIEQLNAEIVKVE